MSPLQNLIAIIMSGVAISAVLIPAKQYVTPRAEDAWQWQEDTVKTAEFLELDCAKESREQLELKRPIFRERLQEFEQISTQSD